MNQPKPETEFKVGDQVVVMDGQYAPRPISGVILEIRRVVDVDESFAKVALESPAPSGTEAWFNLKLVRKAP